MRVAGQHFLDEGDACNRAKRRGNYCVHTHVSTCHVLPPSFSVHHKSINYTRPDGWKSPHLCCLFIFFRSVIVTNWSYTSDIYI